MRTLQLAATAVIILAPLTSCAASSSDNAEPLSVRQNIRLMPPATLGCARNDLTSYTGLVVEYERTPTLTKITIHTDAETTETVEVNHESAEQAYLLNGQPFTKDDWPTIESSDGVLHPNMRVTAWVCLDGKTRPVLDWRPA